MTKPRVLISDALSPAAVQIFKDRGIDVTFDPSLGKDKDKLAAVIKDYDGLAIRSASKATAKLIEAAPNLKVIGRAGIGVDNVDIPAATAKGIIVMNTPFGNSITTAEHAVALMFALARQLPAADVSTQAGKWEKNRFMGVELEAKTLGLIGAGNIGSSVARKAVGIGMKVVAYDPYLTPERAVAMGVEKAELDVLLARADFITLHVPMTEATKNILSKEALAKCKKGVRIINCARGGLVDEEALAEAIKAGHVAGAAFDVFSVEPAETNPLFGLENVICTPHLGASTNEAQENVALQVAEQMSDYLLTGAITNAVNFPSISAEEAPKLKPFVSLGEKLGAFLGQLTEAPIKSIRIQYEGAVGDLNVRPITAAAITGVLRSFLPEINMVNSLMSAKDKGIQIDEVKRAAEGDYDSRIYIEVVAEDMARNAAGTVYQDGKPRITEIRGIQMDAEFAPHMLYVRNDDKPGFIGQFGSLLGEKGINIATFNLGRTGPGGDAICFVAVDEAISDDTLAAIGKIPMVKRARRLAF